MKSVFKYSGIALVMAFLMVACDSHPSLQKYYVDSKENSEFISIDLPASILQLKDEDVSEDVKNTLKTIKKVNFLALELKDSNEDLYVSEKEKISKIFKNKKYKQLVRLNIGGGNVRVNYLGEEDAIDEVIIYGSEDQKGLALVRVIGENMNPSDILKLTQELKMDENSNQLKQIGELMSNFN
jgi:hypothetical protein